MSFFVAAAAGNKSRPLYLFAVGEERFTSKVISLLQNVSKPSKKARFGKKIRKPHFFPRLDKKSQGFVQVELLTDVSR